MRFSSFLYLVRQGLHSMRANRLMTFASMGVLTVCMMLIGIAFLFGVNVDAMVDYVGSQNQTIVYLERDAGDDVKASVEAAIREVPGVVALTYISPEEVLSRYSDMLSDYVNLAETFAQDNPFSPNYVVVVDDVANLETIIPQLQTIAGVESVNSPLTVSEIFISLRTIINYATYGLVAVLALVSMVVISNTIRLTVFARRKEIGIMKLVGATNGFIRFPFFVEGVTTGIISALVASGVICGLYYLLFRWYAENPSTISTLFGGTLVPLDGLWYWILGAFGVFGFVLCGLGTASSIRKHLKV